MGVLPVLSVPVVSMGLLTALEVSFMASACGVEAEEEVMVLGVPAMAVKAGVRESELGREVKEPGA